MLWSAAVTPVGVALDRNEMKSNAAKPLSKRFKSDTSSPATVFKAAEFLYQKNRAPFIFEIHSQRCA